MKWYERQFCLLSAWINSTFYGGDPAESLSARSYRERNLPQWHRRMVRIDRFLGTDHCKTNYSIQRQRIINLLSS